MWKRGRMKAIVTIVLMIGLMAVSVGDSAGLVPGMDTDLGDSDASFWGEDAGDESGRSIAGAGDVNNDGFDDILIGAPYDDDGGTDAGQTYLILGKASGWSMDTDLSNANASFWGEDADDYSGYSVAGAGDVNGDGYDDILIGAHLDDDGGDFAGQTYLILGKVSGWSMDTDLSNSDASFWGEEAGDCSGNFVAGAGDVNGDGYDDILIGSWGNDDGGDNAGQTYLILGKASGWSMDTDLSNSDASFWGEDADDYSGRVASAGDVNGDGYDDILIGASSNDEGGNKAGQVYLIFGNVSGWSMDTDLSNSDASFWGEDAGDHSEFVADAGDVNGDGYDDILISAWGNDDGGLFAGQTYLILGKESGWSMDTDLSNANASFWGEEANDWAVEVAGAGDVNGDGYDDILIGALYNADGGIGAGQTYLILGMESGRSMDTDLSAANASFLGEKAGDYSGHSVAGAGDVNGDGCDDILIGAWGNDNGGSDAGQTYLVFGNLPPKIMNEATPTYASTGDEFTFNITVTDNLGVKDVFVELWYGDPQNHLTYPASLLSGDRSNGTWIRNIVIPSNATDLHYFINVTDDAGLFTISQTKDIQIHDNDPPVLDDVTPSTATTGDNHIFNIDAADNINLTDVKVEYWHGIAGVHTNISMNHVSGDMWSFTIYVPSKSLDSIHYFFYAEDNSTNFNTTATKDVTVSDDDPPIPSNYSTPSRATNGDDFTFLINATDNINLSDVKVEYWYGDAGVHTNTSMTLVSGDQWSLLITVPPDSLEVLHYFFYMEDNSTNHVRTWTRDVIVIDNDHPYFGENTTPGEGTTADLFTFSIEARDNIDVEGVWVEYRYGDGTPVNLSLSHLTGLVWEGTIIIEDTLEDLFYVIGTIDTSGNARTSIERVVDIVDNDDPVIVSDDSPEMGYTGDPLELIVTVTDNIGVASVTAVHGFGDDPPTSTVMEMAELDEIGNVVCTLTVDVPGDSLDPLVYHLLVEDLYGNVLTGADWELVVVDNDGPSITYEATVTEALKGLPLSLVIECDDNIGVTGAFATIRYGSEDAENLSMEPGASYSIDLDIPRQPEGDLRILFSVRDEAGNWFSTGEYEITLVNAAPELEDIPQWTITEGDESTFDLEPYLSDGNDDVTTLTVECDDDAITVEGFVLKAIYSEPKPDWTVVLTVSDGEDETEVELTLHITNVNDVPEILSVSPLNGTEYKEGKVVTFSVETYDEDGDDLTVTWMDGDVTLGMGKTLDYSKLKAGKRVITVSVSDGDVTAEESFTVVIKKEEGTPAFGLVGVMTALLIAVAITYKRRMYL